MRQQVNIHIFTRIRESHIIAQTIRGIDMDFSQWVVCILNVVSCGQLWSPLYNDRVCPMTPPCRS